MYVKRRQYLFSLFTHSALNPCHSDTHSYRQHGITVHVELCADWLLLAELWQNVNVCPFYVFLCCAVDKFSDVSEKRTATKTSHKSPTARRKIPTDHKLSNKTRNLTNSKCPQTVLQLPNINVTFWTDRQQF
jgi:hypothetical protein